MKTDYKLKVQQHEYACNYTRELLKAANINGVWLNEQDRLEWEYNGYLCVAVRNPVFFYWEGYIGLKPGLQIAANTLASLNQNIIYPVNQTLIGHHIDEAGTYQWVGLAFASIGEMIPALKLFQTTVAPGNEGLKEMLNTYLGLNDKYRNIDFVKTVMKRGIDLIMKAATEGKVGTA
jgi:hypothetical protein